MVCCAVTLDNIKACHLNVRSLRNKTPAFSDFVLSNDLDIVGVTETWLRPSDTQGLMDEITPAGFQLHQVPRENKKGGGVAVLVRNDIDSVHCQIDRRETFEHITVKLSDRQSSQLLVHVIFFFFFFFFILFYCILHVSKFFYIKAKIVI